MLRPPDRSAVSTTGRLRASAPGWIVWLVLAGATSAFTAAAARARDDVVLERLLLNGLDPRVRARAALALARAGGAAAGPALEAALIDRHPAVRIAACTALAQLGAADSLPALREKIHDPVPVVARHARESIDRIERRQGAAPAPAIEPRYALYVGALRDHATAARPDLLEALASRLTAELSKLPGAALRGSPAEAGGLPTFRIDASILELARTPRDGKISSYARVALLLTDELDHTLRVVFNGTATSLEEPDALGRPQTERVDRLAVEGAVRAALRNAGPTLNKLPRPASSHQRQKTRTP